MKIGLISDTHDNLVNIEKAVKMFNERGVEFVLHAGDYVAPFSLVPMFKLESEWVGVLGNCDGERQGLLKRSENRIKQGQLSLDSDNRKIVVIHNLDEYNKEPADVVVFGHTHKPETNRVKNMLFVNPGECAGWLTGRATIGILETVDLGVEIIEL